MADTTVIYANRGRWIAECTCREACECAPYQQVVICQACRRVADLEWPADHAAIMRILKLRPVLNQNWLPGESLADLEAENVEHGIEAVA